MISKRFFFLHLILLSLIAALLIIFIPIDGSLDQQLLLPYVDVTHGFIYKNFWWYDQFAHHDLKLLQQIILVMMLIHIAYSAYRAKQPQFSRVQKISYGHYAQLLGLMLISICVVSILKRYSIHSCPWYMLQTTPQQISFVSSLGQGGCFPGGHASLGYAWMAGFFVFYRQHRQLAYFYLCSGLVLGTGMGLTQMMRGAHFLSHNMWTFWVSYATDFAVFTIFSLKSYAVQRKAYNDHQAF